MNDPLTDFDWGALHTEYDYRCLGLGFDANTRHLDCFNDDKPTSDRELYYKLVEIYFKGRLVESIAQYEALLYWKLYSQPAARSNISRWLCNDLSERVRYERNFARLIEQLPKSLNRDVNQVLELIDLIGGYRLPGMMSPTALPVRTTLLHFIFPSEVPIFDQMVLRATGMWSENANHRVSVLREYLPCAWQLADRYKQQTSSFAESSIRSVDMALWVIRGR